MKTSTHTLRRWRGGVILWLVPLGCGIGFTAPGQPASALPAPIGWQNVEALEAAPDGEGFRISRVPAEVRTKLNPAAQTRSYSPAGVEIRFNLVGEEARIALKYVEDRSPRTRGLPLLMELRYGDYLVRTISLEESWREVVISKSKKLDALIAGAKRSDARFDPQLMRLLFPHGTEVRILKVEGVVAPPRAEQVPALRYLAYGSSITHGYDGSVPSDAYPARVGRILGADVINLGFGAGAFLEKEMADWIARREDWDFASLELGVNLLGRLDAEEFRKRVRYFLATIAAARPDKWVFVIDIFNSFRDLDGSAKVNEFRQVVREEVLRLEAPKVVHVEAAKLLQDFTGLNVDLLHPSAEGFQEIAHNLAHEMQARGLGRPKAR